MNARSWFARLIRYGAGLAASALVLMVACDSVHASIVAYDTFDYPDGNVKGCNGGTGWKGGWLAAGKNSQVVTMADPLTYTFPTGELADGGPKAMLLDHSAKVGGFHDDVKRKLAQTFSGDVVYASFLFRDDSAAIGKDTCLLWLGSYNGPKFGMVGSGDEDEDDDAGEGAAGDFAAAAGKGLVGAAFTGDLTLGQTYLIVARISKTSPGANRRYNKIELWIDPSIDDQDTPDVTVLTNKPTVSNISYIGFADTQKRGDTLYVDEPTLGTSWDDMVPGVGEPGVPEPAPVAIVVIGGLTILWRNGRHRR